MDNEQIIKQAINERDNWRRYANGLQKKCCALLAENKALRNHQRDKIISIVKNAISANSKIDIDSDIVSLDGNDVDHIAEQVANDVLGD